VRIFLINSDGKILLHRRNLSLTDSPGKWDQSAGGHVDEGEDYLDAARRETFEELGMQINDLTAIGKFYIEREAPGGMVRRFQTVFIARWDDEIHFNPGEVAEVRWLLPVEIAAWLQTKPDDFTKNFAGAFERLQKHLTK